MKTPIADALGLKAPASISLVGGGGKTTLMYALAAELRESGRSVAVATTTRIMPPGPASGAEMLFAADIEALAGADYSPSAPLKVVATGMHPATGKVKGISPELCDAFFLARLADFLIVEADGSRRLPLKAPGPDEPVVPSLTTHFIAVVGLTCLGKPLADCAFRPELVSAITGLGPDGAVNAGAIARLLLDPRGLGKGAPQGSTRILLLNQADDPGLEREAALIAEAALGPAGLWDVAAVARLLPDPDFLAVTFRA